MMRRERDAPRRRGSDMAASCPHAAGMPSSVTKGFAGAGEGLLSTPKRMQSYFWRAV